MQQKKLAILGRKTGKVSDGGFISKTPMYVKTAQKVIEKERARYREKNQRKKKGNVASIK